MEFEWDETKRLSNFTKRGLDFADVERLDRANAETIADLRFDYGEERFQAFSWFEGRLLQVTFTVREGVFRLVSFRRASRKERNCHGR
jgi:uncharacterized protein